MKRANQDLRKYAKKKNVMMWQIGDKLEKSVPSMTRYFRYELSEKQKAEIIDVIDQIADETEVS